MKDINDDFIKILHFCLVLMLFIGVSTVFVRYFIIPQINRTLDSAMTTVSHTFSERVGLVHNLWNNDNKRNLFVLPKWVNFKMEHQQENLVFVMNAKGWPIDVIGLNTAYNKCEKIWIALMNNNTKLFIDNVEIENDSNNGKCIFRTSVSGFVYNQADGTVHRIENKNR
ncbi:MAG: hypothetical protein ACI4V7_12125 [Succinivibrionaceae bacterium]